MSIVESWQNTFEVKIERLDFFAFRGASAKQEALLRARRRALCIVMSRLKDEKNGNRGTGAPRGKGHHEPAITNEIQSDDPYGNKNIRRKAALRTSETFCRCC